MNDDRPPRAPRQNTGPSPAVPPPPEPPAGSGGQPPGEAPEPGGDPSPKMPPPPPRNGDGGLLPGEAPPPPPPTGPADDSTSGWVPPRWLKVAIIVLFAGWVVSLVSWTYAGSSRSMCATCHAAEPAAAAAASSIHAEVPCLACHKRPGVIGALAYQPKLLWETFHNLTGLGSVEWTAVECSECHKELTVDSPLLAEGHPGPEADCSTCHGDVAHPGDSTALTGPVGPHPAQYVFLHGREAAPDAATCTECHQTEFCGACHLGNNFPHPEDWIGLHGDEWAASDGQTCALCHSPDYCSSCHGAPIPHPDDWLFWHFRTLESNPEACSTCHAPLDCEVCHARHNVHIEQRLYQWEVER